MRSSALPRSGNIAHLVKRLSPDLDRIVRGFERTHFARLLATARSYDSAVAVQAAMRYLNQR
jgi:hypothetical protein